jgi:hypothetical protein
MEEPAMTNEVVPLGKNRKGNEDADASLPAFKRFNEVTRGYDMLRDTYRMLRRAAIMPRLFDMTSDEAKRLVEVCSNNDDAALRALWPGVDIHRPSKKHIAQRLSLLIGSFPNAGPHSPEIFTHMMVTHIEAEEPSAMVLESACRQLVESQKFVPAISEVLEAVREQQKEWDKKFEVFEAVRSGRVKEWGEKLIERLQVRERGERDNTPELDYNHPDSYEYSVIRQLYSKAQQLVDPGYSVYNSGRPSTFKGLTADLIKQVQQQNRIEYKEREQQEKQRPAFTIEGDL